MLDRLFGTIMNNAGNAIGNAIGESVGDVIEGATQGFTNEINAKNQARQSGEMDFKLANIQRDIKILKQANIDTQEFIEENISSNFKNHPYYQNIINDIKFID